MRWGLGIPVWNTGITIFYLSRFLENVKISTCGNNLPELRQYMDINSLETFVTLVSTGSYTKTAQMMLVVQSTISKRIRELENEIGKELIIRDKKSVSLTPIGKTVYEYALKIISMKEDCFKEVKVQSLRNQMLHIGCVPSLFEIHISSCMVAFMKEYPDIYVKFFIKSSKYLLNLLTDNKIDLCFNYQPINERNYVCLPFMEDELILAGSAKDTTYISGVTDERLKTLPLLHENLSCVSDSKAWIASIFQGNNASRLFIGTGSYLIPFIKGGVGYGFVVRRHIQDLLDAGELIEIPLLEKATPKLQSYVVYRTGDLRVKSLLAEFLEEYKKE